MRCVLLLIALSSLQPAAADVVVIANRTRQTVQATINPSGGRPFALNLVSGQVTPVFNDRTLHISYASARGVTGFRLDANSAYYFGESNGPPTLHKIGLGGGNQSQRRPLPGVGATPAGVIPVRLYVDEEEPLTETLWRKKLQSRIEKASDLLLAHSGMTLRVDTMGKWNSDNSNHNFVKSLIEFTSESAPPKGGIAIGFSSQYQVVRGRTHLGGTRGPLSTHILLREWSQHVSENERLELLVHELGHYLGATHSREPDSVMRPVLGDRQSRRRGFDIRFDPANTLIMSMVGEEVRRRGAKSFQEFTPETHNRLHQVYAMLARAMPTDASSAKFVAMTKQGAGVNQADLIKLVLQSATAAAAENAALPKPDRLTGDALTEEIVRRAAADAAALRHRAPRPLLLGLAIAFDDTATLRSLPATGALVREVDPVRQSGKRLEQLSSATLAGRSDLLKHYFISAALTALTDAKRARAVGLAKEVVDANRKSGFSFADLAADHAGVKFGEAVLAGRLTPVMIADGFKSPQFMPPVDGLQEGLTAKDFLAQFGGTTDPRFIKAVQEIDRRIADLPGYKAGVNAPAP